MQHGVITQQLDISLLQIVVHSQFGALGQGAEPQQRLLLLLGKPGYVLVPLRELVVGGGVRGLEETLVVAEDGHPVVRKLLLGDLPLAIQVEVGHQNLDQILPAQLYQLVVNGNGRGPTAMAPLLCRVDTQQAY